jgi:hypothetical protein
MLWLAMSASLLGTFGEHRVAQKNEIAISVVVPCFDRFNLLERTLRACFTQRLPDHLGWEILVCDNHPDQLSRTLVEGLQAASPVPLRYLPAPARNIARARNVGVAAASGRYIAFVDDDEAPGPEWLASYHDCLERTGADAAFGPKYPVFPDGKPPSWDPEANYYTTEFRVAADTPIGRTGRSGRALGCGNSCMRVATCLSEAKPFDEQIGRADGEDALLYFRLFKAGRRFVWCPEAAVEEIQPASRLNFAYMETRLKRGSRTSARCRMAVTDHPAATHALLIAVGLAQVVGHGLLHVLTGAIFQPNRVVHRLGIARGLGKLTYRRGDTDFIVETKLPASRTA